MTKPRLDPELSAARHILTAAEYRKQLGPTRARAGARESDMQRACLDLLALHPSIDVWRQNTAGVRREVMDKRTRQKRTFWSFVGRKGVSDIVGMTVNGAKWVAIEVKRPGEEPTDDQSEFLANVTKRGGYACWVDSVEQLDAQLKAWGL